MKNQLIPPPDLAPPSVRHLPLGRRIQLWGDLLDRCDAFLLASLRDRIGPEGDLQAVYRQCYARYQQDHERAQIQFLENLSRREAARGE